MSVRRLKYLAQKNKKRIRGKELQDPGSLANKFNFGLTHMDRLWEEGLGLCSSVATFNFIARRSGGVENIPFLFVGQLSVGVS